MKNEKLKKTLKKTMMGMLAVVLSVGLSACGRMGTNVQGRTYVSSNGLAGGQAAYGYNYGYNSGYSPYGYNMGGMNTGGEMITFTDNTRAMVRQAMTGQTVNATYFTNNGNTIVVRLDTANGMSMYGYGNQGMETQYQVSSDGNQLSNLATGQILIRQN